MKRFRIRCYYCNRPLRILYRGEAGLARIVALPEREFRAAMFHRKCARIPFNAEFIRMGEK